MSVQINRDCCCIIMLDKIITVWTKSSQCVQKYTMSCQWTRGRGVSYSKLARICGLALHWCEVKYVSHVVIWTWTACKRTNNQYETSFGFRPHPREGIYASGSIISLSSNNNNNTLGLYTSYLGLYRLSPCKIRTFPLKI